ncbi:LacI family transcriptional regulator [Tessaracoccus lapidicaptus]|uniref:LacI family transcriptional regulator n=1 Tax=Tessaracoccus lapidicaptus TaxID=1427523 RepID=A0A1C0AQE8_9ACTN|nr:MULTISPECIES: LacI family DNA-binding transcriptional regulator [Tessaracoccus]AQX15075.1 LacI family transcriptional regulator [Tessaracoccus sp. T2.5-30]OCL36614.1 LacI family transcriptional regulator [Tessaracoccus lapidicaptus]VEP39264.1 Ribose operon repressor [Tessaracoccus lapidicaptus]
MSVRSTATIADVARQAGVSRAAVSKVIRNAYGVSDDMRRRVEAAITELGYRPSIAARAMRGSSYTLGIELPTLANNFFDTFVRGATSALAASPYQLIIAPAGPDHDNGPRAIQALADRNVDGILAVSPAVAPEWLEALGSSVPLVMIGRHDASDHYDTVVDDDLLGARLATEHLLGLGHRRIAHVTLTPEAESGLPQAPHALRTAGYRAAMERAGLAAQIVHVAPTEEATYRATLALLGADPSPTAIFAGHDELAMGALRAVAESGLTAAQCSVVGYDDTDIAAHPLISLTSVDQSAAEMGRVAVGLLLERIAGRGTPVHHVFSPSLVARASSAQCAGRH